MTWSNSSFSKSSILVSLVSILAVIGPIVIVSAGFWDAISHMFEEKEFFWSPSHMLVYTGVFMTTFAAGMGCLLLFRKSGFELLDNIIWNKGETQSNRHKNDGNFTPYYQKPANCYEHMFIFKKPGNLTLSKEPKLLNNIYLRGLWGSMIKVNIL